VPPPGAPPVRPGTPTGVWVLVAILLAPVGVAALMFVLGFTLAVTTGFLGIVPEGGRLFWSSLGLSLFAYVGLVALLIGRRR
jgi:hypothetical protein